MTNVSASASDSCDESLRVIQGRTLGPDDLERIQSLLDVRPSLSRRRISIELAQAWDWRTATGQLKDMAARTLLLKLQQRGIITLPPRRKLPPPRRVPEKQPQLFDEPTPEPIQGSLADLTPLRLDVMNARHPKRKIFSAYLTRHHYLGYRGPVGENIAYLASDRQGRHLACMLFGAAAWKIKPRDLWIGWDDPTRQRRLPGVVNNSRFLILPWVRIPHLASHLLGAIVRRLSTDWRQHYGHPVHLAETFVEKDRFQGTCYRAANWVIVGQTQGRGRQDRFSTFSQPVKDIYLYPLTPRFRENLCHAKA